MIRGQRIKNNMKKIKLKKLTLSEMPTDTLNQINGGKNDVPKAEFATSLTLISLYTVSIVMSACDDCASYTCQTKASQSAGSCCLCTGHGTC